MKRASQLFDDADRTAVAEAVAAAEARTTGEIVPVVASASGRYDRAEDLFGVLVALAAIAAAWLGFQEVTVLPGEWSGDGGPAATLRLGLLPILAIALVAFAIGAALASRVGSLKAPFVSRAEIDDEVERSAHAAFHAMRVRRTSGGTGVLVYVSLFEHRVRVLPDATIAAAVPDERWKSVVATLVEGLGRGAPRDGLVAAIAAVGDILAEVAPAPPDAADNPDELTNDLHLID